MAAILIISALDLWSLGDEKGAPSLSRTVTGYLERGFQVHFITGSQRAPGAGIAHPQLGVSRLDVAILKRFFGRRVIGRFAKTVWWIWFQAASFLLALAIRRRHGGVDVVYGYEIAGVPVAKALSMLWRIPCVSRFQGTTLSDWLKRSRWPIRLWDHILALRIRADLVIMTNDGTRGDRVLERLGVDPSRVRFWMNGVDADLLERVPDRNESRRALGIPDVPMLLTVSRLVPWKRVERCIEAMPRVLESVPGALLVIVGDGNARSDLEALANRLGLREGVRFTGAIAHSDVPAYYAAADLFVSTYDLSNVGNPLLEALASGTCCVALATGDTERVVADGQTGVLVQPDRLSELPMTLVDLLENPVKRERLGKNARRFARASFWSWEERIGREVDEVERLIASPGGSLRLTEGVG